MKALSVKQPWASLICTPRKDNPLLGIKDIENRTWKTHFRGKVFIHASAQYVKTKIGWELLTDEQFKSLDEDTFVKHLDKSFPVSAIIGEVDIIDCVVNHHSIWAEKTEGKYIGDGVFVLNEKPIYNWVLANPVLYDKPIINVKGKLSFWYPDNDIVECIGCSQKFDSEFMEEDDANEKYCTECWDHFSPILAQEAKEIEESEFCECSEPTQSLFPDGQYRCVNLDCGKIWYH